jgi:hypothetical protein
MAFTEFECRAASPRLSSLGGMRKFRGIGGCLLFG